MNNLQKNDIKYKYWEAIKCMKQISEIRHHPNFNDSYDKQKQVKQLWKKIYSNENHILKLFDNCVAFNDCITQ